METPSVGVASRHNLVHSRDMLASDMHDPHAQEVIVEMTNDDGVGGVDYSFECIGNVNVSGLACPALVQGGAASMQALYGQRVTARLQQKCAAAISHAVGLLALAAA